MGEIKSVKVDNWGVFFLQKLQNFFNKTDFCDLTLQFKDNSQLKVHRLVLSACTDFFNVLEQTCELMDDALVMPAELQADVVVPIVNFMYTGTLEFELKMYSKLLRTAKEMNMTVLLKLLEAHKRTMEGTRASTMQATTQNQTKNKRVPMNTNAKVIHSTQAVKVAQTSSQQRNQIIHSIPPQKRAVMKPMQDRNTTKPVVVTSSSNTMLKGAPRLQRGPTRFEETSNAQAETYESSFDSISYESKPLKEEPDDYSDTQTTSQWNRSSPFEQLRKGFNNNKRPAIATFTSPPAKKPNIEDVKEFSEQQRMRKQIAAEFGDDAEFDSIMDDEFHHDDDDEELPQQVQNTSNPSSSSSSMAVGKQQHQQQQQQQQNQHTSIIIKQSPNEKPTIVVKDSSNAKMDHAKIISEVLRQYPHLVKSNKNIKLKIMPNVGGQTQKIVVKKETIDSMSAEMEQNNESEKLQSRQPQFGSQKQQQQSIVKKPLKSYTASQWSKAAPGGNPQQASGSQISKNPTEATNAAAPGAAPQKRRIDSKTMHALIAQGAENTTGPWLCLRCGVNGRPISIPSYRGFRRHLINTHKEVIDAALCEHCGWRSKNNRELHHHMLVEHQVASLLYTFPQCRECNKICLNENDLLAHSEQYHPDAHKQQCIYCNKVFVKEMALYNHMKTFHKKRAREDGVIDFSDDEMDMDMEQQLQNRPGETDSKIKILSDIALPSTLLKLENSATNDEEDYGNDTGPKFVNADGNEMVLTAEQREEIMSQLDQDHDGGVVMVLNESVFPPEEVKLEDPEQPAIDFDEQAAEFLAAAGPNIDLRNTEMAPEEEHVDDESTAKATDEATTTTTTPHAEEQHHQDSDEEHENENENNEHLDDDDHMEWAENLISAHDAGDDDEDIDEEKGEDDEKDAVEQKFKKQSVAKDVKEEQKVSLKKSPKEEDKPDAKKTEDINLKLKMLTGDWTDDEIDDEDETNEDLPEHEDEHKEKPEEEPEAPATSSIKSQDDKTKPEDVKIKEQNESIEEFEHEPELDANNSLIAEDEITQSSHLSEKVDEELESAKEGVRGEDAKQDASVDEDIASETDVAVPAAEEEEKPATVAEAAKEQGRTSRRTSSTKESVANKTSVEDSADVKNTTLTSKKTDEDEVKIETADADAEEAIEKEIDSISKTADDREEANTSAKSEESKSSKTPDKVKSLLNEWADDDDDL